MVIEGRCSEQYQELHELIKERMATSANDKQLSGQQHQDGSRGGDNDADVGEIHFDDAFRDVVQTDVHLLQLLDCLLKGPLHGLVKVK